MIICTDLKRSASNQKPTVSAATILWIWNVSMLFMPATAYDHRYWFEKVCFESETNGFCNNHFLMDQHLKVVRDNQSKTKSVLIWKGLIGIWHQRLLQQPFSYGEASQCCRRQIKSRMIGTDLKRSPSNLKPLVYARDVFLLWNVSMLSMTPKTEDHRYWFEEISNRFLVVERVSMLSMPFKA